MTNILNECSFLKPEGIAKVEEMKNAKYVFESCIKNRDGGWCNFPTAIFYCEDAHPEGSNYFGLYLTYYGDIMVTNAISAIEPFNALQVNDDVIYSRYRHDYRTHKGAFVDGGRDYFRWGDNDFLIAKPVKLCVNKDKLEIVND